MEINNNSFHIQQMDVLGLVSKYATPLYVYDSSIIISQFDRFRNAISYPKMQIHYACKALNNQSILKILKEKGSGLDTVSINEVKMGIVAGFKPDMISYTPNSVSFAEIQEVVDMGVQIHIDSLTLLEQFGIAYGNKIPVCVRINPHIAAGGHNKISVGHIDSKFGISIHQVRHLERLVKNFNIQINGLHMHTGSDILDTDVFLRGAELLFELALDHFPNLDFIDLGSGFKVAYKPDDYETNIEEFGLAISERMNRFTIEYDKELLLIFEPGKYLVSKAGCFFTQVTSVKQTTASVFAGVDSGFNHLVRPMFYDAYHHIVNVSYPQGRPRIYTVVGNICETDTFAQDRQINEINEGDILGFYNAGAYGYTMASNYNARLKPAEVLIHNGKDYLISRRETFEDLLSLQLNPDF